MNSYNNRSARMMPAGCGCCGMNRRKFLAGCAACAAGAAGFAALSNTRARAADGAGKARVRLVFSHRTATAATWPYAGYDHDGAIRAMTEKLVQGCPNVEFLPITVQSEDETQRMLSSNGPVDGYLVYLTGSGGRAAFPIAATGRPMLLATDLFGGTNEFLHVVDAARRKKQNVAAVTSSRFDDVIEAARCFELLKKPGTTPEGFLAACNEVRRKGIKRSGISRSRVAPP